MASIDETPFEILEDATSLIGTTTMNGIAYGVVLTLFIICAHSLLQEILAGRRRNQAIFHLAYISVMFVLGTVYCELSSRAAQLEYVNFRNFPGGPTAYSLYLFDTPIDIVANSAFFATSWMNDALLLWRLSVLYRGSRFHRPVVVGGVVFYLATFAMGLVTLIESSLPTQSFWSDIAITFATAYYALVTSYTIIVTGFMITRILLVRRNLIKATGRTDFGAEYLSVAAIIVESSALYTIWGIIFLGLYLSDSPIVDIFLATLSEVQIIAPLLILYRVSQGKAWKEDTSTKLTDFKFATPEGVGHTVGSTTLNSIQITVDKDFQRSGHSTRANSAFAGKDSYELRDV